MVEQAIQQYIKAGGTAPYGVICGNTTNWFVVPPGIVTVCLPTLRDGAVGVVPLQTLIDLAAKTLWILEDNNDSGVQVAPMDEDDGDD